MARIRTIKPEMPSDEKLARVCRDARLTFAYLITQADDDGLVQAAPRQLLGMLFPHDADVTETMVVSWCQQLATIGVVRWRTTRGGTPVLELVNWSEHQKIKHRAKPVIRPTLTPYIDADSMTEYRSGAAPEDVGRVAGGSPEDGGRVSPTNQQPATMDLGPWTMDRGPATNSDRGSSAPSDVPPVVDPDDGTHRTLLADAANSGTTKLYGERPHPYRWDQPGAFQLAERLADAAVELEFARRCLFTLASTRKPADGKPPRTLRYFADAIVSAWSDEQQRRRAAGFDTPDAIDLTRRGTFDDEAAAEADVLRRIAAGEFLPPELREVPT